METRFGIGEGPEERPLCDLRSVPEAGKLREQVKNHNRALLRSFSYIKQSRAGIFSLFKNSNRLASTFRWLRSQSSLAGTLHCRRSRLLKTGFFKQVMELKIQRKNLGGALRYRNLPFSILILRTLNGGFYYFPQFCKVQMFLEPYYYSSDMIEAMV